MPARPAYYHRLGEAIEVFRRLPGDWIDRRTLEQTLGVSKTVAWRVLRRCGARDGPGNTLVCGREELIAALQQLQKSPECDRELRRRDRLEHRLDDLLASARARQIEVASGPASSRLVATRFNRLPPGVDLDHGRLTIEFTGCGDFLEKVGAVVFALQNDYEQIREFLDG